MNLDVKTGTVGYDNKILVSDGKFSLGKNDKVTTLEPTKEAKHTFTPKAAIKSHKNFEKGRSAINCYSRFTTSFATMYRLGTETNYHSQRRQSCVNTFSDWSLYNMVYVSLDTSLSIVGYDTGYHSIHESDFCGIQFWILQYT